jgi:Zinc finger, C2H2 type
VCNKPFSRKENLITHMARCHNNDKPFECTHEGCGKSFPLKGNLLFHQRSHNKGQDAERPFTCNQCPKDFICKGHLVSHLRSHSGERSHHCQQPGCSKTFVEKGNLLRHIKKTHPETAGGATAAPPKFHGNLGFKQPAPVVHNVPKPMSHPTNVIGEFSNRRIMLRRPKKSAYSDM